MVRFKINCRMYSALDKLAAFASLVTTSNISSVSLTVMHENELLAAKAKLALIITNYGVIMNCWQDAWK